MQRIITQEGPDEPGQQAQARQGLTNALVNLDAAAEPTTGMLLKLVDGAVGWYPARKALPMLPYVAPVAPASGGLITSLSLMLTEHNRLVTSYNALVSALIAQGYMSPTTPSA